MYRKCDGTSSLAATCTVFDQMPKKDVGSWSCIIAAYVQSRHCREVIQQMDGMIQARIQPNPVTFVVAITACSSREFLDRGRKINAAMINLGLHGDIMIQNALLSMYAKGGSAEEAFSVFQRMEDRNRVSWNSMIAAFATSAQSCAAMGLFHGMNLEGIKPDDVSFLGVVNACSSTKGSASTPSTANQEILVGSTTNVTLGNTLVSMYVRCSSMGDAAAAFHCMRAHDTVTWSSLMAGYTHYGHAEYAILLYRDMHLEGIQPDSVTYISILNSCSNAGLLAQVRHFFMSMVEDHCLVVWPDHWKCMVDVLGRAGFVRGQRTW
ncbi:hypothetical protein SELMODRAFT_114611 [Selaginella moellendorffii]|uniref:Pentacotripeptide-repeat region of PRORP domain-containing protein n=1 Tax=Selaginella moellendorffii TaxID=88036 RepID=D8SDV0_SELML|nr:hypothetical protein SELMODRAFT_114611 [Selaginella moellendorffii]